jgi:hypothetical protein
MYTWAFELDMGFLAPFYKNARVTEMMFWLEYPGHAVGKGGAVAGWVANVCCQDAVGI